eukprot:jgi/Mesvir1/3489/Mv25301-RA.1
MSCRVKLAGHASPFLKEGRSLLHGDFILRFLVGIQLERT